MFFEWKKTRANKFRLVLIADNGEHLIPDQGYVRKEDMLHCIELLKHIPLDIEVREKPRYVSRPPGVETKP